jgi:pimeloyl-ACP methyl ester carboxylesterase
MSRFLLVHGVYHGPECWDAVARALRSEGHECHALALQGHGREDRASYDFSGVRYPDYLDDVRGALREIGRDTILVGHSLGGMLVRSVAAEEEVTGAVLMCMPTPASLRRGVLLLLRRFPRATLRFLLTLRSEVLYHDRAIVSWLFWSRPAEEIADPEWLEGVRSYRESRRLFWDLQWLRFRRKRSGKPMLVIGGAEDFALSVAGLREVASFHGAPLVTIPGAPHDVMLTHPAEVASHLRGFAARVAAERGNARAVSAVVDPNAGRRPDSSDGPC